MAVEAQSERVADVDEVSPQPAAGARRRGPPSLLCPSLAQSAQRPVCPQVLARSGRASAPRAMANEVATVSSSSSSNPLSVPPRSLSRLGQSRAVSTHPRTSRQNLGTGARPPRVTLPHRPRPLCLSLPPRPPRSTPAPARPFPSESAVSHSAHLGHPPPREAPGRRLETRPAARPRRRGPLLVRRTRGLPRPQARTEGQACTPRQARRGRVGPRHGMAL